MNSESHYGVPIRFLWGKQAIHQKRPVLSELKGNLHTIKYVTYIANKSTNIVFKLLTVTESDCNLIFRRKICVKSSRE